MLRAIGAIIAGLAAVFATVIILELIAVQLFPTAAGAASMPVGAQIFVVVAWFMGAFVGAVVAGWIARAVWAVWVIAALVALCAIIAMFMIQHPVWMQIATVVAPFLGGIVAHHVVRSRVLANRAEATADGEA